MQSTDVRKGPTGKQKPEISSSESLANLFFISCGACRLLIVHIQERMRFYEGTSALKGKRLNVSFPSTRRGHTLLMRRARLAARHPERARFHSCSRLGRAGRARRSVCSDISIGIGSRGGCLRAYAEKRKCK